MVKFLIIYIYISIKNKYINLLKTKISNNIKEETLHETDVVHNDCYEILEEECFYNYVSKLNRIQRNIMICKYFHELKDNEVAEMLKVSRQSVYKNKKKALSILRSELNKKEGG